MEIIYMDTTAIANIHLNTTQEVFELEKQQFLEETKTLGGLKIKTVKGFFYENRLAALQIISFEQTFHKDNKIALSNGWELLYQQKYGMPYRVQNSRFQYIKGRKGIIVTDFCASDQSYSNFKELMEQPLRTCYKDEELFPPVRMESNTEGMFHVVQVLHRLPESDAKRYEQKMSDEIAKLDRNSPFYNSTRVYQDIYDAARLKANNIIAKGNEINSKKHKNDPSYSVIIIGFIPSWEKYLEEKNKEIERKKTERQKELDIL